MTLTSRNAAAGPAPGPCADDKAAQALALMTQALELIDSSEGAGIAGAHLDLAIHRLREWLDSSAPK